MTVPDEGLPQTPEIIEGPRAQRYVALTLETLIHDVSLAGDRDTAMALGGYIAGAESPPEDVPAFVDIEGDRISVTNPPFLRATIRLSENDHYTLEAEFDSDLHLLIEPPVSVTYDGTLDDVVADLEQTIAEIYRTRGRHLEKLYEGIVDQ